MKQILVTYMRLKGKPTHVSTKDIDFLYIKAGDVLTLCPVTKLFLGRYGISEPTWYTGYHVWRQIGSRDFLSESDIAAYDCFKPLTPTDLLGLKFNI